MNSLENPDRRREVFPINGNKIVVNSRTLRPFNSNHEKFIGPTRGNIVFVPGWGVEVDSTSALVVAQSFADAACQPVTIFDTFATRVDSNSIAEESAAVVRSLVKREQNDLTIVGYSEGGIKAAGLSNALVDSKVRVRGLVLMGVPGVYKQDAAGLIGKFFRIGRQGASQIKDSRVNRRKFAFQSIQSSRDLALSIVREAASSKLKYAKRLRSQLKTIANKYDGYGNVQVPVILIQGVNDLLSNPETTLPGYRNIGVKEREADLQKTVFSQSPYVRMIVGRKNGIHLMPLIRSRKVAKVAFHLLDRHERRANQPPN